MASSMHAKKDILSAEEVEKEKEQDETRKYTPSERGKKGGEAVLRKHGTDFFSKIGKKGAEGRKQMDKPTELATFHAQYLDRPAEEEGEAEVKDEEQGEQEGERAENE
ncbi:hypothetical protein Pelo_4743 [Pelomyxa schiedti]|nr:hypothetical protein Pelo_4743 [Pelomyxa schiedti]